jgi:hypothetical protein
VRGFLPSAFIVLSGGGLLFAISFLWAALRSLFGGKSDTLVTESVAMRKRHELLDEKEAALKSLKDLEFEHEVGKLSDDDFRRLQAEFRTRAKHVLRELDDDLREHRAKAEQLLTREIGRPFELPVEPVSAEKST